MRREIRLKLEARGGVLPTSSPESKIEPPKKRGRPRLDPPAPPEFLARITADDVHSIKVGLLCLLVGVRKCQNVQGERKVTEVIGRFWPEEKQTLLKR